MLIDGRLWCRRPTGSLWCGRPACILRRGHCAGLAALLEILQHGGDAAQLLVDRRDIEGRPRRRGFRGRQTRPRRLVLRRGALLRLALLVAIAIWQQVIRPGLWPRRTTIGSALRQLQCGRPACSRARQLACTSGDIKRPIDRLHGRGNSLVVAAGACPHQGHDLPPLGVEHGRAAAAIGGRGDETQVLALVAQGVTFPAGTPGAARAAHREERFAGPDDMLPRGQRHHGRQQAAEHVFRQGDDGGVGRLGPGGHSPGQRPRLVPLPPEFALHRRIAAHDVGGRQDVDQAVAHLEHAAGAAAAVGSP